MADIALFHSVLGVRPGVLDAAERLRAVGNEVTVVDQYARRRNVAVRAQIQMFNYPGAGHLFTDASRPDEYDADATELLWTRVLEFCTTNA